MLGIILGLATGRRKSFGLLNSLASIGLSILGFTTLWSLDETRPAPQIGDPAYWPALTAHSSTL
jgi:hypothetical protein